MSKIDQKLISNLKEHIKKISSNKEFKHHQWFIEYHLEIVEKISLELCDIYKNADRNLVLMMVWMHDYGKIINFNNQYEETIVQGKNFLISLGFDKKYSEKAIGYIEIMDKKSGLEKAPIEIQIVSSADGASHLVGPFFMIWWQDNHNKDFRQLMKDNYVKAQIDWNKKIILPEVMEAFKKRFNVLMEQSGEIQVENFL